MYIFTIHLIFPAMDSVIVYLLKAESHFHYPNTNYPFQTNGIFRSIDYHTKQMHLLNGKILEMRGHVMDKPGLWYRTHVFPRMLFF